MLLSRKVITLKTICLKTMTNNKTICNFHSSLFYFSRVYNKQSMNAIFRPIIFNGTAVTLILNFFFNFGAPAPIFLRCDSAVTPLFPLPIYHQQQCHCPVAKAHHYHCPIANYPPQKNCKLQIANSLFSFSALKPHELSIV